jgi:hypothetical protein
MIGQQRFPDRQAGSNAQPLTLQLVRFGRPIDLTGATVSFQAWDAISGGPAKMDAAGAVGSSGPAAGVVVYEPSLDDVDTAGEYRCQFTAVLPGGSKVHRSEIVYLRILANESSP